MSLKARCFNFALRYPPDMNNLCLQGRERNQGLDFSEIVGQKNILKSTKNVYVFFLAIFVWLILQFGFLCVGLLTRLQTLDGLQTQVFDFLSLLLMASSYVLQSIFVHLFCNDRSSQKVRTHCAVLCTSHTKVIYQSQPIKQWRHV